MTVTNPASKATEATSGEGEMREVGLKLTFARDGAAGVAEVRRTRLVNPSFAAVKAAVERWARGAYTLQYTDDEGDAVSVGSQEEWTECLAVLKGEDPLRLLVRLTPVGAARFAGWSPSASGEEQPEGRAAAWWDHTARRWAAARSRSEPAPWCPRRPLRTASVETGAGAGCERRQQLPPWCRRGWGRWGCVGPAAAEAGANATSQAEGVTGAAASVARRVLEKLHGDAVMASFEVGAVDAAALGCQHWLKVRQVAAGVVLDVKVKALARELHRLGLAALASGSPEAEEWFRLQTELVPQAASGWYNLACGIVARAGEDMQERACDAFEQAVAAGYRRFRHAARDPDLAALKDCPRFQDLLNKMQQSRAEASQKAQQSLEPFVNFLRQFCPEPQPTDADARAGACNQKHSAAEAPSVREEVAPEPQPAEAAPVAEGKQEEQAQAQAQAQAEKEPQCEADPCEQFKDEIAALRAMGFAVGEAVVSLLQASNGDLASVINEQLLD